MKKHLHSGSAGVDVEVLQREVEELRERNQALEEENAQLKEAVNIYNCFTPQWCLTLKFIYCTSKSSYPVKHCIQMSLLFFHLLQLEKLEGSV